MSDSEYVLYASEKRSCILCAVFRANDVSELSWPTIALPPDLHLEIRKIRNIEVWRSDLLPLITGKAKIPSTPINAFCTSCLVAIAKQSLWICQDRKCHRAA